MAWIDFIKYLAAAYLLYYGINVIIDLLKSKGDLDLHDEDEILEFSEPFETAIIEDEKYGIGNSNNQATNTGDDANSEKDNQEWLLKAENINVSSGGVTNIAKIFQLAQNDAIEITKKIVY